MLYVSFGSKVRPGTFRCVAMGSAVFFILRYILLVYSAGSGVNARIFCKSSFKHTREECEPKGGYVF